MSRIIHRTTNLLSIYRQVIPFIKPYRAMIFGTLVLTLLGALMAQVNPLVLKYTVDQISELVDLPHPMKAGMGILLMISGILLGKELLNIFINFGQKYYGEKIRINTSAALAQEAIDKILTYRVGYFTDENHHSGKLQTRIDRGIESLTRLIQNFFIDLVPLFANALIALVVMYLQNVYVGLVSTVIVPIFFWVSSRQAEKLGGVRRQLRNQREQKTAGLLNLINSILVIKCGETSGWCCRKTTSFKGSVEDNIRYGNHEATREEVELAAKKAYLHNQIMELPEGYRHYATLLSGGQQQRIAIARLFLKDPPIIFLDEPTASLDAIATEQIKNSLDAIKAGRMVVIISHSLSQILDADQIYVMKKGRVMECGTHQQLVKQEGTYREIFEASARSLNLDKLMDAYRPNA